MIKYHLTSREEILSAAWFILQKSRINGTTAYVHLSEASSFYKSLTKAKFEHHGIDVCWRILKREIGLGRHAFIRKSVALSHYQSELVLLSWINECEQLTSKSIAMIDYKLDGFSDILARDARCCEQCKEEWRRDLNMGKCLDHRSFPRNAGVKHRESRWEVTLILFSIDQLSR